MQMTMDQSMKPGIMAFAMRRTGGYVMRSEKRPGYGSNGGGGRKPRKPRAGGFYIFMTLLISILIWPVGMVMLWRKKVRIQVGTKLLISLLTMCASVFLIVFMLTVHVDNERFTKFQDDANDWLNKASADLAVAGDAAYHKGIETWGVMTSFANSAIEPAANTLADGLDQGVAMAGKVRNMIETRLGHATPMPEQAVEDKNTDADGEGDGSRGKIEVHIPANTPEPDSGMPLTGGLLNPEGTLLPDQTPQPTPPTSPEPSPSPEIPSETGEAPQEETLSWSELDNTIERETPTLAVEETAVPAEAEMAAGQAQVVGEAATAEPVMAQSDMTVQVKPAGDATVYYNETGQRYHMQSTCRQMSGASAHTLSEAIASGKEHCNDCGTPDASILDVKRIVWVDDYNTFHTTDECAKFQGGWKLMSLNDVLQGNYIACATCQANLYAVQATDEEAEQEEQAATGETEQKDQTATEEPEMPTSTPAPETVSPTTTLKPAGEATVYHSSNGKFYHRFIICQGMTGSKPYKLSEVGSEYKRCSICDAPDVSLIGQPCLWKDSNNLYHTSDTCKQFKGDYVLVPRDEAIAEGGEGCTECGANEYLVPGTVLAEANH